MSEKWLRSDDPEKWASAAVKCQHPGGFCMSDGFCHYDGSCFRSDWVAMRKAAQIIEAASEGEAFDIANNMREAAAMLRKSWTEPTLSNQGSEE